MTVLTDENGVYRLSSGDECGTDSGPPCKDCKCSIYLYRIHEDGAGTDVETKCMTCHRVKWFGARTYFRNVHEVAEAHAAAFDFPKHHPV